MKQKSIEIKGARVNNLKNISVTVPHGKITVVTGLSGSGKSSLAFDTLYAEGQRRYIESLSSYARQFLGKLDKPETDYIKGIAPAIAIQQKVISNNPRSTVGTTTEIYDYLKLLFARIGKTYSPVSGKQVLKHTISDVVDFLKTFEDGEKAIILSPIKTYANTENKKFLEKLKQQGFIRLFKEGKAIEIEELLQVDKLSLKNYFLVTDRISIDSGNEDNLTRFADSIQIAFTEGSGECGIFRISDNTMSFFNNRFELDGIEFQEPNEQFFAFNNPFGACKLCDGFGQIIGIDEDLVIPNKNLSVYEGAIFPWKGETMGDYLNQLIYNASKFDFPIHRPINQLSDEQYKLLWSGNKYFTGLTPFFKFIESQTYKIQYRVLLSRYRGRTDCPECLGTRLRKDASYVKIGGKSISELVLMPIDECLQFFNGLSLSDYENAISKRILPEIKTRLTVLMDVGLSYLTLNRKSNTLSGGESQRINLATSLGSSLIGSMYILDEPSIGLHPRDTFNLIRILKKLRDVGNTVIIVEHEEEIMKAADQLIDIGPMAGRFGGDIVFNGKFSELSNAKNSLTAKYLTGENEIPIPKRRRKSSNKIVVKGATQYNLKNIDVDIPLNSLVCITGVSGSGKSTLVKEILYPAIKKELGISSETMGKFTELTGDLKNIKSVEFIDQNPIGKSSRSNPITYVKAFDEVRDLFSRQPLAKTRGYKPGFFSFNVEGGRCEMCEGEGQITVSMQFMADIQLPCESCDGKRFKAETLEVLYRNKSISDILDLTISEALDFFKESDGKLEEKIVAKITPLVDVGLGYLKVGQSSSTMSGGETQRIKLASFLSKGKEQVSTLFIFDEPTTGLHFHDISKLLIAFNALIDQGHSIIVIEHNMEVIKCADRIIDLGPEGGKNGGHLLFNGTPEEFTRVENNSTSQYLMEKLK